MPGTFIIKAYGHVPADHSCYVEDENDRPFMSYKGWQLELILKQANFFAQTHGTTAMDVIETIFLPGSIGGLNGGTNALTSDIHEAEKRGPAMNVLGVFFGFGARTIPFLIGTLLASLGMGRILLLAVLLSLVPFVLFAASRFPRAKQSQGFPIKDAARIGRDPLLWLIAVGLAGGMLAPWLAGRIARGAGLRQGLFLPVVNCAMIIVLQILIGRAVKRRRAAA